MNGDHRNLFFFDKYGSSAGDRIPVSFPILTSDGFKLAQPPLQRRILLAYSAANELSVYLFPPKGRSEEDRAAFLAICRGGLVFRDNHEYGEFLCAIRPALRDLCPCQESFLERVILGIASEICILIHTHSGIRGALGYAFFYGDMKLAESAGTYESAAYPGEMFVAYATAVSSICNGEEGLFEIQEFGRVLLDPEHAELGEFRDEVIDALRDHNARQMEYIASAFRDANPVRRKRTTRVRELLWNSYPHICGICGKQIDSFDEMHVDHIIPLSRGGKDILANLQLTHSKCNLEKGASVPECDDEGEETDL